MKTTLQYKKSLDGCYQAYKRAESMGISLQKVWLATLDGRTRHSHRQLDGEKSDTDVKFTNGCKFPGDPDVPQSEVWNCRCTLLADIDSVDFSVSPDSVRRNSRLGDLSYEEWKEEHSDVLRRDCGREKAYGAAELTETEKNDIIKYEENQKKLREMIANGDVTLTINPNIQDRHYQGTSAYKTFLAKGTEESYFLVSQSELQEILNQRYATGSVRIDRTGVPREIFDCGKELAYDTKLKKYTSFVKVHYSKIKTHLSPYTPNDI